MYKPLICKVFGEPWHRVSLFYSTKSNIHNIMVAQLGLDHNIISNTLRINDDNELSEKQVTQNCKILKKQTVKLQNVNLLIHCLKLEPAILTNRILLLEEMGVKNITLDHIARFPASMRKTIRVFKKKHNIPPEIDVVQNMFQSVGKYEIPNITKLKGRPRTSDYYMQSIIYYKTFYLKLFYKPLLKFHAYKYQSFRQITKMLDVLQTQCQIDRRFLNQNPYLLDLDPDNVLDFLNQFKDVQIDGSNIVNIIKTCPRILQNDVSSVTELTQLYEHYNAHKMTPHLNLPRLIMEGDMFILRCSEHQAYPRTIQKKYIKQLFKIELGNESKELISFFIRHPHWRDIPIFSIHKMILYLKKYYKKEEIVANIHLVLYPMHAVKKTLEKVNEKYSRQNKFAYTNSQRLALCLYLLEKGYHFSGDAVWEIMHSGEDQDKIKFENSEECINDHNTFDKTYNSYLQ
ncbi:mitochondrial transcription termination factor 5 [Augochlora pura]